MDETWPKIFWEQRSEFASTNAPWEYLYEGAGSLTSHLEQLHGKQMQLESGLRNPCEHVPTCELVRYWIPTIFKNVRCLVAWPNDILFMAAEQEGVPPCP